MSVYKEVFMETILYKKAFKANSDFILNQDGYIEVNYVEGQVKAGDDDITHMLTDDALNELQNESQ